MKYLNISDVEFLNVCNNLYAWCITKQNIVIYKIVFIIKLYK